MALNNTGSTCGSVTRRNNAITAGATGVLFVTDLPLGLGASGTTWQMTQTQWAPFATEIAASVATAAVLIGPSQTFNTGIAGVMAGFSSRGPSPLAVLKPDVSGPGVSIAASVSRWTLTPAPGSLNVAANGAAGLISGTSMSSPHNAGAAALVKAINRAWTPAQIKSALMMTASPAMVKENGTTPSDPFDRGAGRIDVSRAVRAGFLLNESGANFLAANPATGGNPTTLNLASFQSGNCVGVCTFTRRVRGTTPAAVTWTIAASGGIASAVTVTPASISTSLAADTTYRNRCLPLAPAQVCDPTLPLPLHTRSLVDLPRDRGDALFGLPV